VATLLLEHDSAQVLFGVNGDMRLHRHSATALALNADLIFIDGGGTPTSLAQLKALVEAQAALIALLDARLAAAEATIAANHP
jgi:hypothetical protein